MMRRTLYAAAMLGALAVVYMLGLYQALDVAPARGANPPFANSVEQRFDSVNLLREIRDLLKEQNDLLRSGSLRVVVTLPENRP